MKIKLRLMSVLVTLAVLTAVNGFGKEHKNMEIGHESCGLPNLTDSQKKQIEAIDQNLDKTLIPLKAQIQLKHAELNTLLIVEKPDKAAIDRKIEEIGAVRIQIQKKQIGSRLEIRALLTSEQRTAFDKQSLGPRGGMMMDCGDGSRIERIIRTRFGGPPECPPPPGCVQENEKIELKTE